jgi:DNA-binding phage protein
MKSAEIKKGKILAASIRSAFAKNLTAALTVAGSSKEDEEGSVSKMTLTSLSSTTGLARSTLFKLTNGKTPSGILANPDLETICLLADALNLPPAFLLMTADNWKQLLGAAIGLTQILSDDGLDQSILYKTGTDKEKTGTDKVKIGLELAEKLGMYSDKAAYKLNPEDIGEKQEEINQDIKGTNKRRRLAILTTTAITQNSIDIPKNLTSRKNELAALSAIGAILGANFKLI